MSGTLKEWLAKAEDDFQAAATLMHAANIQATTACASTHNNALKS